MLMALSYIQINGLLNVMNHDLSIFVSMHKDIDTS